MTFRVTKRQSTFWDFDGPEGIVRAHFIGKREYSFVSPDCDLLQIASEHPVLFDYGEAWTAIYMASPPPSPESALEAMAAAVGSVVGPWRSSSCYFNDMTDPLAVLRAGAGLIARAPESVTKLLCLSLSQNGATYSALPSHSAGPPMRTLVAGANFIVARDFRLARA